MSKTPNSKAQPDEQSKWFWSPNTRVFSQTTGKTTYSFAPKIFSRVTIFTHYIRSLPLHWAPSKIKIQNPKSIFHHPNFQISICFSSNLEQERSMSSTSKASWMVAASIGAVEALEDQGVCRWNYPLRSLHQPAKNNIRSYYQAKKLTAQSSSAISSKVNNEKLKQSEESLRKLMYLSCWGPN